MINTNKGYFHLSKEDVPRFVAGEKITFPYGGWIQLIDSSHINTKYTDEQLKDLLSTYLRNEGVPVTKSFDVGGDDETIVVTGVRRGLIPVVSDFIEAKGFEYLGYNGDRDSSLYSVLFSRRVMDSDSADGDSSTTA